MQNKQLTTEELQQLTELQSNYSKIYFEIGQLEIQKRELNEQLETVSKNQDFLYLDIKKIQEKEMVLANNLNEKYGKGTIDINTGEITPL